MICWRASYRFEEIVTVPATINEALALDHIAEWVAWTHSNKIEVLGVSAGMLEPHDGRKVAIHMFKLFAAGSLNNQMLLADYARQGWGLAYDALEQLWLEQINRGEPSSFLTMFMSETKKFPIKRRPGESQQSHLLRDIAILFMVDELRRPPFNMKPTRGATARSNGGLPSGCSLVAGQLGLSEDSVDKIWKRLKSHL